jgi:hypothetical protein
MVDHLRSDPALYIRNTPHAKGVVAAGIRRLSIIGTKRSATATWAVSIAPAAASASCDAT